jgi:hypothetical protein
VREAISSKGRRRRRYLSVGKVGAPLDVIGSMAATEVADHEREDKHQASGRRPEPRASRAATTRARSLFFVYVVVVVTGSWGGSFGKVGSGKGTWWRTGIFNDADHTVLR